MPVQYQVIIIYAAVNKYLLEIEVDQILDFKKGLFEYLDSKYPEIPSNIRDEKVISDETEELLKKAIPEYIKEFKGN